MKQVQRQSKTRYQRLNIRSKYGFTNIRQNGVIYNIETFHETKKKTYAEQLSNECEKRSSSRKAPIHCVMRAKETRCTGKKMQQPEQVFHSSNEQVKWYCRWIDRAKIGKHVNGNISKLYFIEPLRCCFVGRISNETIRKHAKRARWIFFCVFASIPRRVIKCTVCAHILCGHPTHS